MTLDQRLRATIRDVPDFPTPGILFKDITPVLLDAPLFAAVTHALADAVRGEGVTHVVGIESRGFIFGAPVAQALGVGFVPVRKPGKLPFTRIREEYALEYGSDAVEMHADAVGQGARVVIVDDVLATGGTAAAAMRLVERQGATVVALAFCLELGFLDGRARLGDRRVASLVTF